MARRKAKSGNMRSLYVFGALATAFAGGGYLAGKNGVPLPPKLAALVDKTANAAKPAVETIKAEVKFAESPTVKSADKSELSRLLKTGDAKDDAKPAKAAKPATKVAKAETPKTETAKSEPARTEAKTETKPETKPETARAETKKPAKTEVAKADADAPIPSADIPGLLNTAEQKPAPEKPAQAAQAGGAPLGVAVIGTGIPTSEDSKVRLSVGFANLSGKPIRAFEGLLKFADRQDKDLFASKISVSALIAEGATLKWDERIDPDKLDTKGKKLIGAGKEDLKAVFYAKKVFFVDGSVQTFGAKGERVALR